MLLWVKVIGTCLIPCVQGTIRCFSSERSFSTWCLLATILGCIAAVSTRSRLVYGQSVLLSEIRHGLYRILKIYRSRLRDQGKGNVFVIVECDISAHRGADLSLSGAEGTSAEKAFCLKDEDTCQCLCESLSRPQRRTFRSSFTHLLGSCWRLPDPGFASHLPMKFEEFKVTPTPTAVPG